MSEPTPSFLKARVAAARAKSAQAPAKPTSTPTKPPAPQKPAPVTDKPLTAKQDRTAKSARNGSKRREMERCEIGSDENPSSMAESLAALVASVQPNALAVTHFEEHLPAVFDAVARGAKIVGPAGHQDRMTLFRMLGLPWVPFGKSGGISDASAVANDRLATAISRLERRLVGQEPVTVDIEAVAEPVPMLPMIEVGHTMTDRLPVSDDRDEVGSSVEVEAPQARGGEAAEGG